MSYLDIPKIYSDPVISRKRRGDKIQPFIPIKETITVDSYRAILTEIPNDYERVKVTGRKVEWYESDDDILLENSFRVDYVNGIVYFHESVNNVSLNFEYVGEGVWLYPDSRVYFSGEGSFPTVRDKFEDVDRAILVQKSRVDELIVKNPQPSEVVDTRIDYNGKIFKVAKDRIDAEQKKIEEAYYDAKGKRFDSLKKRIDSLQLATEEHQDDQLEENVKIWASIDLIPGKISMETGKLEEKINGDIKKLTSRIDLVPEQITLKVEELRDSVDDEFYKAYSQIEMMSDEINLKVDVNGVVSSINLSEEGVRISGKKLWLDGDTRIENATIKSAHIDSLSADKIRAGVIDAGKVKIHGGSSTEYTTIDGAYLESRGKHTRLWRGKETTHDVRIRLEDGRMRFRNESQQHSLYYSDFGISNFADGAGSYLYDTEKTSGTIEFMSRAFDPSRNGLSIFSSGTVGFSTQYMELRASRDITVNAKGMFYFANTNVRGTAIGVRNPSTNFYIGTARSDGREGELRITDKRFFNNGKPNYMNVRAKFYYGRAIRDTGRSTYVYIGSDKGLRVTSRGLNQNDSITYRPVQASSFRTRSSRDSKENITDFNENALSIVNNLKVVNFNYKGDEEKRVGFIAEDSPRISREDGKFVDLSDLTSYLTKAVQELTVEVNELKKKLAEQ